MKTSKIAKAQALHRLLPKIKRAAFFEILQQPQEVCSGERYWFETSRQTPWDERPDAKKKTAKAAALKLIRCAVKEGRVVSSDVIDVAKTDPKMTALLM
jgi:hypothetical protein